MRNGEVRLGMGRGEVEMLNGEFQNDVFVNVLK